MNESERITRLMEELLSNRGYAEGRRSFPRTVTAHDAQVVAGAAHAEMEHWGREREHLARRRKLKIACEPGCAYCCEQPVTVYLPEAIRIAGWLRREENSAARAAFMQAYPEWLERAGEGYQAIEAAIAAGDVAAEEQAHLSQWTRRAMCAFNDGGMCAIYQVRPAVCRHCHALGSNESCRADRFTGKKEDLPSAITYVPLDQALARAKLLGRAMHNALGGARGRPMALCRAVHKLLTNDDPRLRPVPPDGG